MRIGFADAVTQMFMSRQVHYTETPASIPADSFVPHPHLSDVINHNIIQSEIEGGVYLPNLVSGDQLEIVTRDWVCHLEYLGDCRARISGHWRYCPEPVEVTISGSTWGGSLLKLHFIGRGMHMEFFHPSYHRVLTSRVLEIQQV